jgi:hypothetical protein
VTCEEEFKWRLDENDNKLSFHLPPLNWASYTSESIAATMSHEISTMLS